MLRPSGFVLRAKREMSQRGKFFFAFLCISEHFESIETHFFFRKFFVSAKRKTCSSEASKVRADWSDWLYQSFIKNHSQLSYCSSEIVYAVKDCDPCGELLLRINPTRLNYLLSKIKISPYFIDNTPIYWVTAVTVSFYNAIHHHTTKTVICINRL